MLVLMQILMFVGVVVALVGGIWQWVEIYRFSTRWGWLCLFVPFASIVFLSKHYHIIKKPFFLSLSGIILIILGTVAHSFAK